MKKVAIITITDGINFGNKLQNYATQSVLEDMGLECYTLKNFPVFNNNKRNLKAIVIYFLKKIKFYAFCNKRKMNMFRKFKKNIKYKHLITSKTKISKRFDYFVVGSDQVWKPNFGRLSDVDLLTIAKDKPKISFSASFGISELPENCKDKVKENLQTFKAISVREMTGMNIVKDLDPSLKCSVLVDPTMLLDSKKWEKLANKPHYLNSDRKYILLYFLGNISAEEYNSIKFVADSIDADIIEIMDKNCKYYSAGPSEFLYYEKNAELICTDSFHSSVFALLFNKPFVVFKTKRSENMTDRIDTLLSKFQLDNRRYNGVCITKENLEHDYKVAYDILNKEREVATKFLKDAFDI